MVRREFSEMVFCSLSTCLPPTYGWLLDSISVSPWFNPSLLLLPVVSSTDEDTAQYLSEALATSSQDQRPRKAMDVKNALEEVRTSQGTKELGFEDRVSAALSILGVPRH